ncbi:Exocyst complex component EXO70A1 [Dichanthelium oligosanthes]|uniref:Exocyst subunit Exo70 family protein n=1 Tax=Dichanthelium oligosanthes TaxID=888268 RepID=A0A1E5WJZ2_9POAL|nr:Exocyst complex component EXO70A1 [Dichanthelium oligosanthes]
MGVDREEEEVLEEEERRMASLLAARQALRSGVDRSRALGRALAREAPRLEEIQARLPLMEASVRPIRAATEALETAGGNIDRALGPAAAVLKVFDAVHGLEPTLLARESLAEDLPGYLAVLAQLEAALRLLADNCGLAAQWLADIVAYLGERKLTDPRFVSDLSDALGRLKEEHSAAGLDAGLLAAALGMLEAEFRRLLAEHSAPLAMKEPDSSTPAAAIVPSRIPPVVVHKLSLILDRLAANGRLDGCSAAYADARGDTVGASLRALGLDYLKETSEDAQVLSPSVERWGRHLEFAVHHLLEAERKLCAAVFERRQEAMPSCFAEIAARAGILDFLKFGRALADTRKDPIKLLRLLDVFDSLNKLRPDFNRLFGGKACAEIQSRTRELVKMLVDGSVEIFEELLVQVELQRNMPPPVDGGVPRLVSFVAKYCNQLLGEPYRSVLTQVITIHRSWRKEAFDDKMLVEAVLNIVKTAEINFETWSKAYGDTTLSCLFMLNVHWHFFKHLKGTKLGELLGDAWLREHEQYKDYYSAVFLRESWGTLAPLLSREGLIMFSKGQATARDLVKQRLKSFNANFDEMFQKQSTWVISDRDLQQKTCHLVVQAIVPIYRSFMQNYGPLVEQDISASKYVKYSAEDLDKMLNTLFLPKPGRPRRAGSFQIRNSGDKITSAMTGLYRSASTLK